MVSSKTPSLDQQSAMLAPPTRGLSYPTKTILIQPFGGHVYHFLGIEKRIVDTLLHGAPITEIYSAVAAEFDVTRVSYREDIDTFLIGLAHEGLIHLRACEDPRVSIVVPCLNSSATLVACLDSLMALTPPLGGFEIIFVDNGSTDCSLALARQYPVTVLQEPKRGRSTARNAGIRIARGSLIAFVDADCVVETNWLCRLVDAMCPEHVGGAQGAFIIRRDEPKELSAVGPGLTSYFDFSGYLPVLATGGCIYRREILNRLNGFDERLNSFEDVDLTWRVVFLGYSLSVVSDVVVYTDAWLTWKKSLGRTIECFWATFTFKAKWRKTRLPRFHRAVGRELQAIAGRLVRVFEKSPGHVRSARIRTAVSRTISLFASCASFLLLRGDCVDGEEQDQRGSVNWGQLSFDGATYQMASHVRAVFEPHLAHIIDLTARTKMPLNLVAATILGAVFSGVRDVNAIVELVREVTTGATEEDARRDTTLFLMDLIEKSILVKTEE